MCCQILKPKVPAHFDSAAVSSTVENHQDCLNVYFTSVGSFTHLLSHLHERMHFGTSSALK